MPPVGGSWPLLVLVVAGIAYAEGLRATARLGRPYPRSRAVAFYAGLVAIATSMVWPVGWYADLLLSVHMTQHLLLTFVAAPLLVLGAPISLALRSSPRLRGPLLVVLRSRVARALGNPVVAWLAFAVGMFAVHLTPLYEAALEHAWVHALEHALFLAMGWLFWAPVIGRERPPSVRLPDGARLLYVATAAAPQALLALAIVSASEPLYPYYAALPAPWGPTARADQGLGGVLMWFAGSVVLTFAALLVAVSWRRTDERKERSRNLALERHAA
jgi:putative copper resistance protein D